MSNHLTPSELSSETGIDRRDVIATCIELGVPIFEGKIDKTLFAASLRRSGGEPVHVDERTPAAEPAQVDAAVGLST